VFTGEIDMAVGKTANVNAKVTVAQKKHGFRLNGRTQRQRAAGILPAVPRPEKALLALPAAGLYKAG
jgi:hypothetical protein